MEKVKAFLRYHPYRDSYLISLLIFVVVVVLFGQLADEVHEGATLSADQSVLVFIRAHLATSWLDSIMPVATEIGGKLAVALATVVLITTMLFLKKKSRAVMLALCMGGLSVAIVVLKLLFARERPQDVGAIVSEASFSFPSGHSMASAGLAITIILLLWNTKWCVLALVLGVMYTLFVGFSRLYLGVHYPTDVIAGYLLAFGWVVSVFSIFRTAAKPLPENWSKRKAE